MRQLLIKPQIHNFETMGSFAESFAFTGDDLIFTEQFLYDTFIKELALPCKVLCRDAFGLGEPSDQMIDQIALAANKLDFKRLIAVGGGSIIDIAKILALKNNVPSAKIFLKETPIQREKTLIVVPTTCGTGSEMTNLSIANIVAKNTKLGIGDDIMCADHAVLIPQFVKGLPYKVFIYSAIDALVHAVESYVSPKANVFTKTLSIKAAQMFMHGFVDLLLKGKEIKSLLAGDFLTASCIAGIAFSNAGVGPVHALAYPLGGAYHVPHGETNAQFFAEVMNLYQDEKPGGRLNEIGEVIMAELRRGGISCTQEDVFEKMGDLLQRLQPNVRLHEYGMKLEEIEIFAQSVMDNQQRLLINSYVPFTKAHALKIYQNRY